MSQSSLNEEITSLLKIDDRGWNIALFEDKIKMTASLCENCNLVCCDAVELGCDHDDNDICSYCKDCLTQLINTNNGKCPINGHQNPIVIPVRSVRRQILKAPVMCPYSKQYKKNMNNDSGQVIDTIGGDEKEGIAPNANNQNNNMDGCDFKGTLADLMQNHLAKCVKTYNPSFTQILEINALKLENKNLNEVINDQLLTINNLKNSLNQSQKENSTLNTEVTILRDKNENLTKEIAELTNKISSYGQKMQEMKNDADELCQDEWDGNNKTSCMSINGGMVENIYDKDGTWGCVYGTTICKAPFKYHWRLGIQAITKKSKNCWKILVGVRSASSALITELNETFCSTPKGYGFIGSSAKLTTDMYRYGEKFDTTGDIIDIYLDLEKCILSFAINGTSYGVAYSVDKENYRLALSLVWGRKIQLITK